jgi:hypothetical protein
LHVEGIHKLTAYCYQANEAARAPKLQGRVATILAVGGEWISL